MTTKLKTFTPGPWKMEQATNGTWMIHEEYTPEKFRYGGVHEVSLAFTKTKENAQIIAAAPELLAACKELVAYIQENYPTVHVGTNALDAIAKADGR